MQRVIAVGGLIVTLPLLAAAAAAVAISDGRPVLHIAQRVGQGGRQFSLIKLRTMTMRAGEGGPRVTLAQDSRVTRPGRFLRRYRLDELPQLWNVARGEMLLVGPRPEDPRFVDLSNELHRVVFSARPGITGLTQLAFVDEAALIDPRDPEGHYRDVILPRKLALDADYLSRRSLRLDLWILGQTLLTAIGRRTRIESIEAHR